MAQQGGTAPRVPQNDLYTALLIMSAALLLIGAVYVAVRSWQLFGSVWPAAGG